MRTLLIVLALIVFVPVALYGVAWLLIWILNTVFPVLHLQTNWKTMVAVVLLFAAFNSGSGRGGSK